MRNLTYVVAVPSTPSATPGPRLLQPGDVIQPTDLGRRHFRSLVEGSRGLILRAISRDGAGLPAFYVTQWESGTHILDVDEFTTVRGLNVPETLAVVRDTLGDYVDVEDAGDGIRPNKAMRALMALDTLLDGLGLRPADYGETPAHVEAR